jgi:hypothetical protein
MRHSFIPAGSIILIREGTKVFNEDGSFYIATVDYTIELSYDSPETEEWVFWMEKRCKKVNILVATRPH